MAKKSDGSTMEQAKPAAIGPEKVLRIDDVSISIFRRELKIRDEQRIFYNVSFSRSYKDSSGVWRYAKSFDLDDLGRIIELCQQADEYIRSRIPKISASSIE